MSIKASEISDLIQARIKNFDAATEARNVGTVVSVTDGICRVHGLADAAYGEMLEFPDDTFGLALNLEQDSFRRGATTPHDRGAVSRRERCGSDGSGRARDSCRSSQ
jgi:F0F1-type ATP synthase alpha subunit